MSLIEGCFRAPLIPEKPDKGDGFYDFKGGSLRYYSDGGEYFFHAATGSPAFYIDKDGLIFLGINHGKTLTAP